jgi:hypothetical protein
MERKEMKIIQGSVMKIRRGRKMEEDKKIKGKQIMKLFDKGRRLTETMIIELAEYIRDLALGAGHYLEYDYAHSTVFYLTSGGAANFERAFDECEKAVMWGLYYNQEFLYLLNAISEQL